MNFLVNESLKKMVESEMRKKRILPEDELDDKG
jgi:hypothetical protein